MKSITFRNPLVRNILIAILAIALLGGIGAGVWFGTNRSPLAPVKNVQAIPETAMFMPRQTPFMASLLVNADHLKRGSFQALSSDQQRQVQADLSRVQQRIKENLGIDYDSDIAPWAGEELTIAFTSWDVDRNMRSGITPGFLVAVAVGDANQAESSLQRLWQRQSRGLELVREQYSGVTITFPDTFSLFGATEGDRPVVATAQVGTHYVLFANSPNVLRDAVNTLQTSNTSLGNSALYRETLSQLPTERIGLIWLNLPEARSWLMLQALAAEKSMPLEDLMDTVQQSGLPPALVKDEEEVNPPIRGFEGVQIVAGNLAIAPGGLVADTVLIPTPGNVFPAHSPQPVETLDSLQYIPADSALAMTSHDLASTWQRLTQWADRGNPLAQHLAQALTHQLETRQVNFAKDVLPWAAGDYAIAYGGESSSSETARPDWVLAVSDSADAQKGIRQLDAIAQNQGFNLDALDIGDQKTTIWTRFEAVLHPDTPDHPVTLETDVDGIHGTIDGWDVISSSVGAIGKALLFQDTNLGNSGAFQRAIAALEPENDGYVVVDGDLARTLLVKDLPEIHAYLEIGHPLIHAVRSLVMTHYESQPDHQRFGVALQF